MKIRVRFIMSFGSLGAGPLSASTSSLICTDLIPSTSGGQGLTTWHSLVQIGRSLSNGSRS